MAATPVLILLIHTKAAAAVEGRGRRQEEPHAPDLTRYCHDRGERGGVIVVLTSLSLLGSGSNKLSLN